MRGENPYFRIPGTFSITADHWMLRGVDQEPAPGDRA